SAPVITIRSVAQTRAMATGVWVSVWTANADSIRIAYESADGTDTGSTPWFPSTVAQVPVLGLRSHTSYRLKPKVSGAGTVTSGNAASYLTDDLPVALQTEAFTFLVGHAFSSGLNLVAVQPKLSDCFV